MSQRRWNLSLWRMYHLVVTSGVAPTDVLSMGWMVNTLPPATFWERCIDRHWEPVKDYAVAGVIHGILKR